MVFLILEALADVICRYNLPSSSLINARCCVRWNAMHAMNNDALA